MTCLMRRYKAFVAVNVSLNCCPNITTYRNTGMLQQLRIIQSLFRRVLMFKCQTGTSRHKSNIPHVQRATALSKMFSFLLFLQSNTQCTNNKWRLKQQFFLESSYIIIMIVIGFTWLHRMQDTTVGQLGFIKRNIFQLRAEKVLQFSNVGYTTNRLII